MGIVFFASAREFRVWLEQNHKTAGEIWLGFYKKASGRGGISYPEALDEALCFGWIDGIRKGIDGERYKNRFTPRKARSIWSLINIGHIERLTKSGRMHSAGVKAFECREQSRSGIYSYENEVKEFTPSMREEFSAQKKAWSFFQAQPPGYRRVATWLVMSAKREETRQRRLKRLIKDSAAGKRLDQLTSPSKRIVKENSGK